MRSVLPEGFPDPLGPKLRVPRSLAPGPDPDRIDSNRRTSTHRPNARPQLEVFIDRPEKSAPGKQPAKSKVKGKEREQEPKAQ